MPLKRRAGNGAFPLRHLDSETNEKDSLDLFARIQGWLRTCMSSHSKCQSQKTKTKLPTRVLDLRTFQKDKQVRLLQTDGQEGAYIALSYLWGSSQPLQTTQRNLEQHSRGLVVSDLARAYRDAILLVSSLGIPYLWIDALCIIQDNDEDRAREIGDMAFVYENALIVLIAAWAPDPDIGFLRPRLLQAYGWSAPLRVRSPRSSDQIIMARTRSYHLRSDPCEKQVVNLRGWTSVGPFLRPAFELTGPCC